MFVDVVMCRPYRLRPSLLTTFTSQQVRPVAGLTELDNKLYVVYQRSDTINVFTTEQPYIQFRRLMTINVHPRV